MERVGWVNSYSCEQCKKKFCTVNLNTGVTPMFKQCPFCRGPSASHNYILTVNSPQFKIVISHAWYRPKILLDDVNRDHVLHGGLLFDVLPLAVEKSLVGEPSGHIIGKWGSVEWERYLREAYSLAADSQK